MIKNLIIWAFIISVLSNVASSIGLSGFQDIELGRIIYVNALFRHGDRTPIDPYPNDPYRNATFWPVGFGQLTNTGKQQEFALGQWLRGRYDSLLTDQYDPEIVHIQSTDVDRTLMSAATNLAGMFPPQGAQQWSPYMRWQPIPIHTIPELLDKVLAAKAHCPAYEQEFQKVLQSQDIQDLNNRFKDVYKILNEKTGKKIKTLEDIEHIYNTLFIESLYNYTLPTWAKNIFPEPMKEAAKYSFALQTWTPKLARLKSGLLVKELISHMTNKTEHKHVKTRSVSIYSAHDTTLANLLHTLSIFDLQSPPYASTLLMELREDVNGNHNVMLFYRNSSDHDPYILTLPGCSASCPLAQFISLCQPLIPQDWDSECRTSHFTLQPSTFKDSLNIVVMVIASLLIILAIVVFLVYKLKWKQQRPTYCDGYSQLNVAPWYQCPPDGCAKLVVHTVPHTETGHRKSTRY